MQRFLAAFPDVEMLAEILGLQDKLRAQISRQGVRFLNPEKIHLRLKLFDDLIPVLDLATKIQSMVSMSHSLELSLKGIDCEPNVERPKTIGLRIDDTSLSALISDLEKVFDCSGPVPRQVSLVRVSPPSKAVGKVLERCKHDFETSTTWRVSALQLMDTLPTGAYAELGRFAMNRG